MIRPVKPRVLLVSPYDLTVPGGVAEHVLQLAKAVRGLGYESTVLAPLTPHPGFRPGSHIWPVGPVMSVPTNGSIARITLSLRLAAQVKVALATIEPDIVHLHEPFMPLLPFAALRHSRAVNVATFHAYAARETGFGFVAPLLRHFDKQLAGRIAVSESARSYAGRYFPGSFDVIPNGVDWERFATARPYPEYYDVTPTILFVGRLDERKGFPVLLRAYAELRRRRVRARLLVVGAYSRRQAARLQSAIEREQIPDVSFAGWATSEALARYFQSSSVVCVPSLGSESFGVVLLEAMAAGKPVVASSIAGYREVISHEKEGLLVPPGEVTPMVDALQRMLDDAELRSRFGQAGREKARGYAWPQIAERIARVYRAATADNLPPIPVREATPEPSSSGVVE